MIIRSNKNGKQYKQNIMFSGGKDEGNLFNIPSFT